MASHLPDDSMVRHVHRERAVAFAGGRALLLMAAHPVAFEGFFASTGSLDEPYERLARAGEVLDEIAWGDRKRANVMTRYARTQHANATGSLPVDAGRFPAGTTYRADDPELLLWILACLVDSSLLTYERLVRPLSEEQKEGYWRDYRVIGKLFGLKAADMPRSYADFVDYWDGMLAGDTLAVTPRARELGTQIVLHPPVPLVLRPAVELFNQVTIGWLPSDIRRGYGLRWDPVRGIALAAAAEYAKRVVLPLMPDQLRLVPSARRVYAEQAAAAAAGPASAAA